MGKCATHSLFFNSDCKCGHDSSEWLSQISRALKKKKNCPLADLIVCKEPANPVNNAKRGPSKGKEGESDACKITGSNHSAVCGGGS